jgi:hemolysin III
MGSYSIGIIYKIFFRWKIFSTVIYIAMGLIMLVGGRTFFESIPLISHNDSNGAALYLVGVVFYLWKKIVTTMVWHFVLVAAVCHYVAILWQ